MMIALLIENREWLLVGICVVLISAFLIGLVPLKPRNQPKQETTGGSEETSIDDQVSMESTVSTAGKMLSKKRPAKSKTLMQDVHREKVKSSSNKRSVTKETSANSKRPGKKKKQTYFANVNDSTRPEHTDTVTAAPSLAVATKQRPEPAVQAVETVSSEVAAPAKVSTISMAQGLQKKRKAAKQRKSLLQALQQKPRRKKSYKPTEDAASFESRLGKKRLSAATSRKDVQPIKTKRRSLSII